MKCKFYHVLEKQYYYTMMLMKYLELCKKYKKYWYYVSEMQQSNFAQVIILGN